MSYQLLYKPGQTVWVVAWRQKPLDEFTIKHKSSDDNFLPEIDIYIFKTKISKITLSEKSINYTYETDLSEYNTTSIYESLDAARESALKTINYFYDGLITTLNLRKNLILKNNIEIKTP